MTLAILSQLLFLAHTSADLPKLEEIVPHAAGVALVEVTEVMEYDMRPADGDKGVQFKLKRIRGTGEFREAIRVTTEHGGLRPPGSKPAPSVPVRPDGMKLGERYWVAYASREMAMTNEFNQGVIAVWPEKEKGVAEALDAAVKADVLGWFPQYDPKTDLTYGYVLGEKQWKIRVEKDGKLLWERFVPGKKTDGYFAWGLWGGGTNGFPAIMPPCKQLLVALSTVELEKDNEFGLETKPFHVTTGFDPESGRRYAAWVSVAQQGLVYVLHREYDPESGHLTREDRFDGVKTGGKALGAKTEEWGRKTSRAFDPMTGKLTKEEIFWYDADAEHEKRWVKVKQK